MAAPCDCENEELDKFKDVYKLYKRRDRPLNTEKVLNGSGIGSCLSDESVHMEPYPLKIPETCFPGLKPVSEWKAFQLTDNPGLIIIANPFKAVYQRYWVLRCLMDFPLKPNKTNLDAHMQRPSDIWATCASDGNPDLKRDSLLMRLRWATLGYQYEWNTKEYFCDCLQSFPDDLAHLCGYIAATLDWRDFSSEAGIVNYYRMESTLMGHTDVSELEKAAPLISFSFGQDCIFLSGGLTKATEPIPLFLHSGDICVMTGHARLSYHAVPRILTANQQYLHSCFHGDTPVTIETVSSCKNSDNDSCGDKHNETGCKYESSRSDSASRVQNGSSHEDMVDSDSGQMDKDVDTEDTDQDPYSTSSQSIVQQPDITVKHSGDGEYVDTTLASLSSRGNKCTIDELGKLMETVIGETDWTPFEKYLSITRVNVNVRQVLKEGMTLNTSPESIVPLPCPGLKT